MTRNLFLSALLAAAALAGCVAADDTQTITGKIDRTGFTGTVLGARAIAGDSVVATTTVDATGGFSLEVPRGTGYRLEIMTSSGAQPLVAGTGAGSLVAMRFDVCAPVAPYDLGNVYQGDAWPGPAPDGHDGGCGCDNPDPNGNCPPPPPPPGCDPSTDPNCLPCPNPNSDGTCPPPCDPTTDPNCAPPPPPPCDPTTDPSCAPCPDPSPDGTCPPPCDPSDPNCVPPPPPPGCDPTTDPNCLPCPNPDADGTCPPPCDPSTDPNCVPPPPPDCPYDDPTMCWPPPQGEPCNADGTCDPGQCAVPDQPVPSFGCGA